MQKYFKKKIRHQNFTKEEKSKSIVCHNCNKSRHFRNECPKKIDNDKKESGSKHKKAMIAIQVKNNSKSKFDKEDGVANFYMMAKDNDNNYNNDNKVNSQNDFDDLYENFLKYFKELKACKKNSKVNLKRVDEMIRENESLVVENKQHQCKLEKTNTTMEKFSNFKEVLKNIVEYHKCSFDKTELGFDYLEPTNNTKNKQTKLASSCKTKLEDKKKNYAPKYKHDIENNKNICKYQLILRQSQ